jgi:hypothetical protein
MLVLAAPWLLPGRSLAATWPLCGPCLAAAWLSLVGRQGALNCIYIFNAISDCSANAPAVTCDLKDEKLTLFMLISERALRGGRLMASTGWTCASVGDGTARNGWMTGQSC